MPYKDPERQRAYKREWERARRAGVRGTLAGTDGTVEALPTRAETPEQILNLLEEQIHLVRTDAKVRTVDRARTIGYLLRLATQVVDSNDLAQRLAALEETLEARRLGA